MKAALTVADLPKGWDGGVAVDPTPTPGSRGQYDPSACVVLRHPDDRLGTPATAVRGQYFTREPQQWVTEWVWSWRTSLSTVVPDVTDLLTKCSNFTMVASDKKTYSWAVTRIPLGGSADAIALRYDSRTTDDGVPVAAEYVGYAAANGTLVHLDAVGEEITDAVFAQIVRKAAARLEAAIG